jgi:hypothetical protein
MSARDIEMAHPVNLPIMWTIVPIIRVGYDVCVEINGVIL